jgi:hypothetical protein
MDSNTSKRPEQQSALTRAMPPKPPVKEPETPLPKEAAPDTEHGEGNYKASKDYNDGLKRHLATADTEQEARDAAPDSPDEAADLQRAEAVGQARSRDKNPAA